MRYCEAVPADPATDEGCRGHLAKFDDCVAEVLWRWGMEDGPYTGSDDFEGVLMKVRVPQPEAGDTDSEGWGRTVIVPAGVYLVWQATTGGVTVTTVATDAEADEVFGVYCERYERWERGCDPDDAAGHERCEEFESCQRPEWAQG